MRSQLGSCSIKGQMNLNLKLVMVPRQFIDYVIVHELYHLIEHNHGSGFYALMSRIMPASMLEKARRMTVTTPKYGWSQRSRSHGLVEL
jgi:predicted metal-dependent hydrolase